MFKQDTAEDGRSPELVSYYDYQLSEKRGKFDDKVLTSERHCCQGQLPVFPLVTCRLQGNILLTAVVLLHKGDLSGKRASF